MDGNKDESDKCIRIAEDLIHDGQRDKALKYLQKAEKLYPSQRAKDLICLLQKLNGTANFGSAARNGVPESPSARRRQSASTNTSPNTSPSSEESEFSQEQIEAVKGIKKCKDYYEILGVNKEVTDSELKKAYRKLALQFHPDKNKAPGAAEAFKAIGNAFAVLSDVEKRKQYDMYGSEEARRQHGRSARADGQYDFSRGFEGDMPAEEIFNMFFGGGFPSGNVYVRRGNRWYQQRQSAETPTESGHNVLLQMMPILVLVCLSLMSSFFVSDPPYSLQKTQKYFHERKTSNLKLSYFVKDNFVSEYQGNIRRIENQVEEEIVSNLRASCFRERNYKESLMWRARNFHDSDLESKAKSFRTPSCETLSEIYTRSSG